MTNVIELVTTLKKDYDNLPKYKKFFFPRNLKFILDSYNNSNPSLESVWPIYNVFLNQTSSFQRIMGWFFTCLKPVFSFANLTKPVLTTKTAQTNFMFLATHGTSEQLVQALELFNHRFKKFISKKPLIGTLMEICVQTIAKHKNPKSAAGCLANLYDWGLLTGAETQAVLDSVIAHQDPNSLSLAIIKLGLSDIRTQANFVMLATHSSVLFHEATKSFWDKLSFPSMKQKHFNRIIQISEQHKTDPIAAGKALEEYLAGEGEKLTRESLEKRRLEAERRLLALELPAKSPDKLTDSVNTHQSPGVTQPIVGILQSFFGTPNPPPLQGEKDTSDPIVYSSSLPTPGQ
ncbi:MAG: hypothetical protein QM652_02300 [Legionella sp.]|uniref:hypothetical protein n=1 Tax=Legionella sp. TaxID=459 RepID=UPI0039E6F988